jgi:hypothetical protein
MSTVLASQLVEVQALHRRHSHGCDLHELLAQCTQPSQAATMVTIQHRTPGLQRSPIRLADLLAQDRHPNLRSVVLLAPPVVLVSALGSQLSQNTTERQSDVVAVWRQ